MLRIRFHVNSGSKSHFRMSLQKYIEACLYNMIKLGKFKGYLPGFFFFVCLQITVRCLRKVVSNYCSPTRLLIETVDDLMLIFPPQLYCSYKKHLKCCKKIFNIYYAEPPLPIQASQTAVT